MNDAVHEIMQRKQRISDNLDAMSSAEREAELLRYMKHPNSRGRPRAEGGITIDRIWPQLQGALESLIKQGKIRAETRYFVVDDDE